MQKTKIEKKSLIKFKQPIIFYNILIQSNFDFELLKIQNVVNKKF